MFSVTPYVPMIALVFAMFVQTIGLIIWITRSITELKAALEHFSKTAVVAEMKARIDVLESNYENLQRQIDDDKAGRAAFSSLSGDVAALKAMMQNVQVEVRELRVEVRRGA